MIHSVRPEDNARESAATYALDADHELWVLLRQARDAVHKVRDNELRQFGISSVQASILFIIQAIGHEATAAEISRWIFRRPHGVSMLLNRMQKKELIKRVKSPQRKNVSRIIITTKGQKALDESAKGACIHRVMSTLDPEEQALLKSYLLKLRDTACEDLKVNVKPSYPL
jgi:DNA-binding MarR family transcriptional regulator